MPTRRQEKMARVIRDVVSDAIANHLNDPRIESFVSVTRAEVSADLRIANVYLSIFGGTETARNKTFAAIMHAKKRIQMLLAEQLQVRFSPVLNIHRDDKFKKTLEIMKLIDDLAKESNPSALRPDSGQDSLRTEDKDSVDQGHD
jgi:ribosome-binding factor A